jgi:hypothetical protein
MAAVEPGPVSMSVAPSAWGRRYDAMVCGRSWKWRSRV